MNILKAYKYRLYPTTEQAAFIQKTFASVRLVYNLLLEERIALYKELKANPELNVKLPTPAKYKKEYPILAEVDSLALANAQGNLDRAFKNFYQNKAAGFPKRKKKRAARSYTTNNQRGTVRIERERYLKIPKLKTAIKMAVHRPLTGTIKSVTISMNASGKYFASILCETATTMKPATEKSIGVVRSAQAFAVLSTGEYIGKVCDLFLLKKKLILEKKKLNRRKKIAQAKGCDLSASRNYQKQKLKVAKLREKLFNQQADYLNKLTTQLINKYDIICIEDVETERRAPVRYCRQYLSDLSWSLFVSKLEYKAQWYGKKVIRVTACKNTLSLFSTEKTEAEAEHLLSRQILATGLQSF